VAEPLKIRSAIATDADAIHELHTKSVQELCAEHYTPEQIAGWLKQRTSAGYLPGIERNEIFVAEAHFEIVGFGHAIPGEVLAVFVAPDRAHQGIGTALLAHAMDIARKNAQWVVRLEATLNAQKFYERAGFVVIDGKTVRRGGVYLPVLAMECK